MVDVQHQRLHRSTSAPQQYQLQPSPLLVQHPSARSPPQPQQPQSQSQSQAQSQQQYSYQQHQQHRQNLLRSNSITSNNSNNSTTNTYVNGAFSTPLRADNTFLKMTNATQSYPLHIRGVPYATTSRLQTLDVCLPRPLSESPKDAVWVV
ncbi:Kynurenine formamidase [Diplodia seriata]|uniref:Kynurenine formamidase n=1 Tax=Diplodia seriata TaxID=420778 RepID=A0ABR3CKP4_9PEZI